MPEGNTGTATVDTESAAILPAANLPTLPDPANETPVGVDDASDSELANPDALDHEVEPFDQSESEPSSEAAGIDRLEPNDVQADHGTERVAPVEEEPMATGDAESDAGPSSVPTPTGENAPELVDPFGEGFEEEEIVIDRYADRDGGVFAGCPRVSSEEGDTLASIIDQHASPQLSVVEVDSTDDREASDASPESNDAPVDEVDSTDDREASNASPQSNDAPVDEVEHAEVADESDVGTNDTAVVTDDLAATDQYAEQALANHVIDATSLSSWMFEQTMETLGAELMIVSYVGVLMSVTIS